MRRAKDRRTRIMLWVISLLVVTSMCLSLAITLVPPRQVTPTPIPTFTPTPPPTKLPSTPTEEIPAGIQIGSYVKIVGTDGDGLRMREEPSLNGKIIYLGLEDEIFLVVDGPEDQDGYLWWHLEAPLNKSKNGWAVSNFLLIDQNP